MIQRRIADTDTEPYTRAAALIPGPAVKGVFMAAPRIPLVLGALLLSRLTIGPGYAQECTDWSLSPSLPVTHPGIAGTTCAVFGDTVIVAGDQFQVVDVSDIHAPQILGAITLPGTAEHLVLVQDHAVVVCAGAGLVGVDFSDPGNPVLSGPFGAGRNFTSLARFANKVLAVENDTTIHALSILRDGTLKRKYSVAMPEKILALGEAEGFLVVLYATGLVSYDCSTPTAPVEVDRYADWNFEGFRGPLAIDGPSIYLCAWFTDYGEYVIDSRDALAKTTILQDGNFSGSLFRYVAPIPAMVANRDFVACSTGGATEIFNSLDLSRSSRHLTTWIAGGFGRDKIALLSARGLTLIDMPHPHFVRPEQEMVDSIDWEDASYFDYERKVGQKSGHYLLAAVYHYSIMGGPLGGKSMSAAYNVYDIADPGNPRWIYRGANAKGCDYEELICRLPSLSIAGVNNDKIVLLWNRNHFEYFHSYEFKTISALDGTVVSEVQIPYVTDYLDGALWARDYQGLIRYELHSETPTASFPIGTVQTLLSPGPGVLINAVPSGFDIYDTSDPLSLTLLSHFDLAPALPSNGIWTWHGQHLVYAEGTNVQVLDFSVPAAPVLLSQIVLPEAVGNLKVHDDHLAVAFRTTLTWLGLQVFAIDPAGQFSVETPFVDGYYVDAIATDSTVYAASSVSLSAFDISNPSTPKFVGQGFVGGSLGFEGDFLLSGPLIYRRDCRDLSPVQAAASGIGNGLPPGQEHGPAHALSLAPNPFNPSTEIRFSLASAQVVRVSVFDVRGREIVRLADGPIASGDHSLTWTGKDAAGRVVSAGVYFIRLQSDEGVQVGKAILLK